MGGQSYGYDSNTVRTFNDAVAACDAVGARLATIESEEDFFAVSQIASIAGQRLWFGLQNDLETVCSPDMTTCEAQVSWNASTESVDAAYFSTAVTLTTDKCNVINADRTISGHPCTTPERYLCQFMCQDSIPCPSPVDIKNASKVWDGSQQEEGDSIT